MNKKTLLVCAGVLVLAAMTTTALAGHIGGNVKSYTACVTTGGALTKIKEGDSPLNPCTVDQVVAHFSGGDITSIAAQTGGGLTGGGTNGAVSLSLRRDCASGDVVKWNGSTWACAADSNSTYTAGTGLDLTGSEFSIEPVYRVKNSPCPSGHFATGFDSDGDIRCAVPPSSAGVQAYSAHVGAVILAGTTTVISKTIPAGTYLLFASVALVNQDGDDAADGDSEASCSIPGFETGTQQLIWKDGVDTSDTKESLALSSAINHSGGAVELRCTEASPDVDVWNATLTAIKVDSLG